MPKTPTITGAGFSLIETVLVVVAILIMLAIATPALTPFLFRYHMTGALQEVRGTIQDARIQAVSKNVRVGATFVIIDDTTYQWVIEDRRVITGADQYLGEAIAAAELLGNHILGQTGPVHRLPGNVTFGDVCPNFAAASSGLRFNDLGMMCQPGSDTELCPALAAGANLISYDAALREARVCLVDEEREMARTIRISGGGQVEIVEMGEE